MPLPSKRAGQSKKAFISSCMSSEVMLKEFPDQTQRAAVCYQRYGEKKTKASYIVRTGEDEILHTVSMLLLPETIIAKVKTLPESGVGFHRVIVTLKDGTSRTGIVSAAQDFETEEDMEDVIAADIIDVAMND